MSFGIISSIGNWALMPFMAILIGNLINEFTGITN
jgi:hypothetical protein